MDFSTSVKWHIAWLTDILGIMEDDSASMRPTEISRDDICDFGKWLRQNQAEYGNLPEFEVLDRAHKELHQSAANAVKKAHAGQLAEAKRYLSPHGEFIELSKHLLDCSNRFFQKIDQIN